MYSKPIIMEHLSTVHTSFIINFKFTNNITLLMGDSGTGKTASFSFIEECATEDQRILCLNYLDYQKDIQKIIEQASGKLIVIDNADILLNDDMRKYIAFDCENQYLIIGRNPQNLLTTRDNLFELISIEQGERTEFQLAPFL